MTLVEYINIYGEESLVPLAEAAGTKSTYLWQLIYKHKITASGKPKRPSYELGKRLVEASGGILSDKGLLNPIPYPRKNKSAKRK